MSRKCLGHLGQREQDVAMGDQIEAAAAQASGVVDEASAAVATCVMASAYGSLPRPGAAPRRSEQSSEQTL